MCFILLYFIYNTPQYENEQNTVVDLLSKPVPVNQFKHNCEIELVYAIDDEQCRSICKEPNEYFVQNGACVNVLIRGEHVTGKPACDPRKGVVAYMSGDSQLGTIELRCMSLDPGIQPDDVRLPNRIIRNGFIKSGIDYLKKFPDYNEAECFDPSHKIITIPNTETIRAMGVCVPDVIKKLFRK